MKNSRDKKTNVEGGYEEALSRRTGTSLPLTEQPQVSEVQNKETASAASLIENLKTYQAELEAQNEELRESQRAEAASRQQFSALFANLPLPGLVINNLGVILQANDRCENHFGMSRHSLQSHYFPKFINDSEHWRLRDGLALAETEQDVILEAISLHTDVGIPLIADLHIAKLAALDTDNIRFAILVVDQTELLSQRDTAIRAEAETRRLNKTLTVTSSCRELLSAKNPDEKTILGGICKTLTENSDYSFAIILKRRPSGDASIDIISQSSLDNVSIDQKMLNEELLGSTTESILNAVDAHVVRDIVAEPVIERWQEALLRNGLRTLGVFPLSDETISLGTLLLATADMQAFTDAELQIISHLTADIANYVQGLRAQQALLDSEVRLAAVTSRVPGVVYQFRLWPDGRSAFPYSSGGMMSIYGVSPEDVREDASQAFAALHPADLERVSESINRSARELDVWHEEYRVNRPDGSFAWVEGEAIPSLLEDGSVLWNGYIREVTARKNAEAEIRLAASVFEYANEGIIITDPSFKIIQVNNALCRITGHTAEELVGQSPNRLLAGPREKSVLETMWRQLETEGYWTGEVFNRRKDGGMFSSLLTSSTVRDTAGEITHYVSLFSDITPIKEYQQQLEHIAHHDPLTDLPNRVLFATQLRNAMAYAVRHSQLLALAYLDLDSFKLVNDQYGHDMGDQLLETVARRMKSILRGSDVIARLGGDEFALALSDLSSPKACLPLINRLLTEIAKPITLAGEQTSISASIGIRYFSSTDENLDPDQLMRQADQAMYQAKQTGKNRYQVFDPQSEQATRAHHEGLERLRQALVNDELCLFYQPQVNMRSGEILGVEALIRWRHPERGILPPADFIYMVETDPLSIELGQWVLRTALDQFDSWLDQGLRLPVSVNVSALHLQQPDFVANVKEELARHRAVGPGDLKLEVLETAALEDINQVAKTIAACRDLDVGFALDDFGTGYSSLKYLKQLSADLLKIDQSFVRDMLHDAEDLFIIEGVLALAGAFHRNVIAEGVESDEHRNLLVQLGCDWGQGYAIARPLPADDVVDWVEQWRLPDGWSGQPRVPKNFRAALISLVRHRAWLNDVEKYLEGEILACPEMDVHDCALGQWLSDMQSSEGASAAKISLLTELHHCIHAKADELLRSAGDGTGSDTDNQLTSLRAMTTQLQHLLSRMAVSAR